MLQTPRAIRAICGFHYVDSYLSVVYLAQVSLSAHCTIVGSTSRTTLTQTFVNHSKQNVSELRYTFPIYDGVSVVGFTCTINNDRVIRGVVKERGEARTDYQEARERGETAGLLEGLPASADVFTTSVANVPAGAEIKVELVYLGELKHDAEVDGIRFTIPTAIAPRYSELQLQQTSAISTNVAALGGIHIVVDAEMPSGCNIKNIQSPSHPISVTLGNTSAGEAAGAEMSLQKASATISFSKAELDKDFILQVVATNTGDPIAILETHPTIPNHRALMATLVPRFNLPSIRPEVVFVCDRSGSMGIGNKIPNLKSALHIFLKSLPVGVKFNICSFGTSHEFLFKSGSTTYDAESLDKAMKYVDKFDANFGGTEMYEPIENVIKKRYKDMPLQIVLLTDGEIWNQERLITMINKQVGESQGEIRIFTLGIGESVSHSLIEGVARAGNGFSQAVGGNENMSTKVVRMLKASLTPLVKDYTLEVKYGSDPEQDADDDFEIVEKVMDTLSIDVPETPVSDQAMPDAPKKPISLFDTTVDPDVDMTNPSLDSTAKGKYSAVPPVPQPKLLQTPFDIPPLYPFSRTTIYLLLSAETSQRTPKSVVLRGTSVHGPLELEIPVAVLPAKGETIHQLAARSAVRELEGGRGWIFHAKDAAAAADGALLRDRYPGRFPDMVERAAVHLGVQFGVAGRWCSFVAVGDKDDDERPAGDAAQDPGHLIRVPVPASAFPRSRRPGPSLDGAFGGGGGGGGVLFAAASAGVDTRSSSSSSHAGLSRPYASAGPRMKKLQQNAQMMVMRPPPPPAPAIRMPQGFGGMFDDGGSSRGYPADRHDDNDSGMAEGDGGPVAVGFDAIVARQSFDGSWAWDEALLRAMGIEPAAMRAGLRGEGELERLLGSQPAGLATAVVLAFLESELADRKGEWEMLAEKAVAWLDGVVAAGNVPAADYVAMAKKVLASL
ncbi:von Willebrand factor type A domain-containing protein [Phialemonium atrogriseum]|uniref:von Willebrand factor type A domain-containing protein n=1 Tax=Phialemonium atrogriseum TaxID=1093897 RepID=A0AAJ0BVF3_9PEZI|nr:von Willebrand factor type A domain-containing protein [Phialemonium atrogriseum]KAK1764986.1 von Willebrand factor type A domain-containing protein [Phialemonium atrogriseum]